MSIHPSLSSSSKGKRHRTVLKRYERLEKLKKEDKWTGEDSVFGLPKVKIIKFKIKKEKPVEAVAAAEGAPEAAAEAAAAPAEAEKGKAEKVEKKEAPAAKEKEKK